MAEVREKLIPYLNRRVQVRGTLSAFDIWTKNYREVGRACISAPEIDYEVVAHHVWVIDVRHWPKGKDVVGSQVEFEGLVIEYTDKNGKRNYSFSSPDELRVLHLPSMSITGVPPDDDDPPEEGPPEDVGPPQPAQFGTDPLQVMRQVKSFAKACGGLEPAERMVTALQDVTIPPGDLVAWIKALRDE